MNLKLHTLSGGRVTSYLGHRSLEKPVTISNLKIRFPPLKSEKKQIKNHRFLSNNGMHCSYNFFQNPVPSFENSVDPDQLAFNKA